MKMVFDVAPNGCVWVCPCCGKYGSNRQYVGDVSCYINAVLCDEESLEKDKTGRVVKAKAVKVEE